MNTHNIIVAIVKFTVFLWRFLLLDPTEAESGHTVHVHVHAYSSIASVNFTTKIVESTFVFAFTFTFAFAVVFAFLYELTFTQASETSFAKLSILCYYIKESSRFQASLLASVWDPLLRFAHAQFQHPRTWVWFWMLKVKGQCPIYYSSSST